MNRKSIPMWTDGHKLLLADLISLLDLDDIATWRVSDFCGAGRGLGFMSNQELERQTKAEPGGILMSHADFLAFARGLADITDLRAVGSSSSGRQVAIEGRDSSTWEIETLDDWQPKR